MNRNEKLKPHVHLGLATVLAAAVVNTEFCSLLLTDPKKALEQGYLGEPFILSAEEAELFLSIRADNLPDLAKQILTFEAKQKPPFPTPTNSA